MRSLVNENERGTLELEPIPDVPLTVIASKENLDNAEFGKAWRALQKEFTELVSDSDYVVANTGHFVQVERPKIVVDAIRDVLKRSSEVRSGRR